MRARIAVMLWLAAGLVQAPRVLADEDAPAQSAPVTAYRPGTANPAVLPVPRFLEFDAGWNRTRADDRSRSDSLEYQFKYAFTEDTGVLLAGDAFVRADERIEGRDGPAREGFGDTALAWKQRFLASEQQAFGLIAGVQLPTAQKDLGEDGEVWSLIGIWSRDVGAVSVDVNAIANWYEQTESGVSRWESGWAIAAARDLSERIGISFDLSGSHRRGEPTQSLLLSALSFTPHPRLILDAGISYGLNDEDNDVTLLGGVSVSLGRL